jgi:tRNA(Ile)-lysidine synthase
MPNLPAAVEAQILSRRLLQPEQPVLVAVSGGLDSMVLLHLLRELAPRHKWPLWVAHFDHQLRGRSSELDARFVKDSCRKLEIPFIFEKAEVKSFARKSKISIEMAARRLRHEFLARAAREHGISKIALAHHADDQVELFFLRLLRGAGPEGLSGMKWSGASPADSDLTLIRPLLGITRAELAGYGKTQKVRFREDATNASSDFFRNRIRLELLPLLQRRYQPAVHKTTLRLMDIMAAESEMLSETARAWVRQPNRSDFAGLPLALQRRVLQAELFRLGLSVDFELVEWLRVHPDKPISIQPRLRLVSDVHGHLQLLAAEEKPFAALDELAVDVSEGQGSTMFESLALKWEAMPAPKGRRTSLKPAKGTEWFDADKVGSPVVLRHWRPGDRFQPIGMSGTVKLQDWFSNLKVPRSQRHRLLVAATTGGEVFWVENQRISEKFKMDGKTRRVLVWSWHRP